MENHTILLVDDEPRILHSLSRELQDANVSDILTASNASEGLDIIRDTNDICVVVSDYRMPGMDGIIFLTEVSKIKPDITRIILTGMADLNMAIEAVNKGHLFRLLTKPCPEEIFIDVVFSAFEQYRLVTAERELLNKTLNGSVKILIDILSVLNPEEFSRSTRLRDAARKLGTALNQADRLWEVELAALLCLIGSVAVPKDLLTKWEEGIELTDVENQVIRSMAKIGKQLVQNIPRLENIADAVGCEFYNFDGQASAQDGLTGEDIPFLGRLIRVINDYDIYLEREGDELAAYELMTQHGGRYDPQMLEALKTTFIKPKVFISPKPRPVVEKKILNIENLEVGMLVSKDLYDKRGRLVVSKGTVITEALRYRLINFFWSEEITEPVTVNKIDTPRE